MFHHQAPADVSAGALHVERVHSGEKVASSDSQKPLGQNFCKAMTLHATFRTVSERRTDLWVAQRNANQVVSISQRFTKKLLIDAFMCPVSGSRLSVVTEKDSATTMQVLTSTA
jgi:hypothetical protein